MKEQPGVRVRQKTDRRIEEIRDTALRILSQRGYAGTTMELIASELGYTKPALYYYFRNKEEIIRSLMLDAMDRAAKRIHDIQASSEDAVERLRNLICYYLDDQLSGRSFFSIFHQLGQVMDEILDEGDKARVNAGRLAMTQAIMTMLESGVSSGQFRGPDPQVLGSLILAMLSGISIHASMPALAGLDKEAFKNIVTTFILRGICT